MPQLSNAEIARLDKMLRLKKTKPLDAWRELKKSREKSAKHAPKGEKLKAKRLSPNTVYTYCNGHTHKRGKVETRGRKPVLSKGDVRKLMQARRRLIQKNKGRKRIKYADIMEEAALDTEVSQRTVEDAMRVAGVRYRPARKKIHLAKNDAQTHPPAHINNTC